MKKSLFALVLAFCLIISAISVNVAAEETKPELPKAIVTETAVNSTVMAKHEVSQSAPAYETPVTFTMNFKLDPSNTQEQHDYYHHWYCDFVLTINKDIRGVDGYLVGQYDLFSEDWVRVGDVENTDVIIPKDTPLKVMHDVFYQGNGWMNYDDIIKYVQDFDCGIYLTPEFIAANTDVVVTLELRMYNNHDFDENYVIGDTYTFTFDTANVGGKNYSTLEKAFEAARDGEIVTLLRDIVLTDEEIVIDNKEVNLDLAGHSIVAYDNTTKNYQLFHVKDNGAFSVRDTVGNGFITLEAKYNNGWDRMSNIIENRGGTVDIYSGILKHLGGTDMAYVINNNVNYAGDAIVNVHGGTLHSTYTAIRIFMDKSSTGGIGKVYVYDGVIGGGTSAIWAQSPNNYPDQRGYVKVMGGTVDTIAIARTPYATVPTTIAGGTITGKLTVEQDELYITGGTIDAVLCIKDSANNDILSFDPATSTLSIYGTGELVANPAWATYGAKNIVLAEGITSIASGAFKGFDKIETITLPSSLDYIKSYAFSGCAALASITLPEKLTTIGYQAFADCTNLAEITMYEKAQYFSSAIFDNVLNLTVKGYANSSAESYATENSIKFEKIQRLTSGAYNANINWSFDVDTGTFTLTGSGKLDGSSRNNIYAADIKHVVIGEGIVEVGIMEFLNCDNIETITLPSTINYIKAHAFSGCTALTSVELSSSLIGFQAFAGCTSLTSATMHSTARYLSSEIFNNCSSDLVICGEVGSAAQSYAENNSIRFLSID